MRRPKSLIKVAGIALGGVGIAVCLGLIVLAWVACNSLGRATEGLFNSADRAPIGVRQRVVRTQERVAEAKTFAGDIERSLLDWTKQEVSQRAALQLNAAEKSEQLANTLEAADLWLEVAESSVGLVRESLGNGALESPARTAELDGLIEELASLRAQFIEATEVIDRIRDRVATQNNEPLEARIEQGAPLARHLAATLGSTDARFGKVEERLTVAQSQVQDLAARARWWLLAAPVSITLFLLWMAAGQAALYWYCFNR